MTPEEVWRAKSDDEVIAAVSRLDEFNEIVRRVILQEFDRRQLNSLSGLIAAVAETDTLQSSTDVADRPPSANPLTRLWRGDVSLPVAYWGWGLLGNLLWVVLLVVVAGATKSPIAVVALAAVHVAYSVVVVVGVWRSSARYTGKRIWSDLARVGIALSILRSLAELLAPR